MGELLGVPPGDGLISALVTARREEDGLLSEAEPRNLLVTLVFAAHDTTRHQLANAMIAFAEHPDQWRLLGSHPELAGRAVEEVIRWRPSAPTAYRFAERDFDFAGRTAGPTGPRRRVRLAPTHRDLRPDTLRCGSGRSESEHLRQELLQPG